MDCASANDGRPHATAEAAGDNFSMAFVGTREPMFGRFCRATNQLSPH
jgi:hypothetical protein